MKYKTKTEEALRGALLQILRRKPLADITVSELAREAQVSRSTFYEHFGNPADVYDSIVMEFSHNLAPIMQQIACSDDVSPKGAPFCTQLRNSEDLASAFAEDRFLPSFLANSENLDKHDLYSILTNAGYHPTQARAVCAFQLAGCFTAAQITGANEDWNTVKAVIDRFILGGIAACLAAKAE